VTLGVGGNHACATLADAAGVYCWGINDVGQLGVPVSMTNPNDPVKPVKSGFSSTAKAFVVGEGFTCVLDATGLVKCAGGRFDGTLGNGSGVKSDIPIAVPSLATVADIAGGVTHACALDKDGVVSCWGQNDEGQCGQMGGGTVEFAARVMIPAADKIWAGEKFSCAHTTAGEIYCWGANNAGQWGDDKLPGGSTPTKAPLEKYATMSFGGYVGCGIDGSGQLDCWGPEISTNPMKTLPPTKVDGISQPNAIASGSGHHCAWASGVLACWGVNTCGQLGVAGTLQMSPTPVTLPF
jgi:alpha-tubulin suppressor-like RCC1 family protein